MQRSETLAVGFCLLLLASCGEGTPARSANAPRPAKPTYSSHVAAARPHRPRPASVPAPEPSRTSASPTRAVPAQSSEQLQERYAQARALSVQRGSASYYSDKLAGRPTASGAPYEPQAFTAAHRNLPLGSVLRVTRVDGGQVIYVRVNDRGPFGPRGRILDLSRAAAERLGMLRAGVVKIKLEVLEYGPRKPRRRRH